MKRPRNRDSAHALISNVQPSSATTDAVIVEQQRQTSHLRDLAPKIRGSSAAAGAAGAAGAAADASGSWRDPPGA